jgi:hypothetical protein
VSRPAVPSAGSSEVAPTVPTPKLDETVCSPAKMRSGIAVANASQATERRAE